MTGLTVLVTGEAACVTVDLTGAGAAVTGAATFVTVDTTGLAVLVTGAAVEVTGADGVPEAGVLAAATEVTVLGTDDTADVTPEATDVSPDAGCCADGDVAAWACLENTSMRKKKPAAAIANCPTRRAIRREIGRGISSSHTQRT